MKFFEFSHRDFHGGFLRIPLFYVLWFAYVQRIKRKKSMFSCLHYCKKCTYLMGNAHSLGKI